MLSLSHLSLSLSLSLSLISSVCQMPMSGFLPILLLFVFSIIQADSARKELRTKELLYENIIQGERPIHYNRIDPSRVVQLSWQPRVFLYQGFLLNEECDHLISLAKRKQVTVGAGGDGRNVDTDDVISARIEDRISAWTFLPKENSKPFQILHSGHEDLKQKYDYFGNKLILLPNEHLTATVILYLSNVSHGGQILFPESEGDDSNRKSKKWSDCEKTSQQIRPTKGNALLFFNIHLNASLDKSSSHARCPVVEGELWFATKIFPLKKIPEKEISLESEKSDCTDEDENCSQWAATGECERNPVYMIGSLDYYGTCRKSCNSC